MPRAFAISAALGLALATGLATAGYAVAAPSTLHSHATVQSSTAADHDGWGGWDDDDGDCNGTGNICA
ncbi:hypothetical protein [Streptomyces sp. NPDC050534]|jgi:hypothetical protein|uniref:hypothetical protein n=1 Tax=unclassified Streptomyces TaxID=2593676 RepID=UPI0037A438BE